MQIRIPPEFYKPHKHQLDWHRRKDMYVRWMCGGIGSGKTYAGVVEAGICAFGRCPGRRGMIIVPDYSTFRDVTEPLLAELWPPTLYRVKIEQGSPKIYCQTSMGVSEILIRSAMNKQVVQRIDGPTIAWAWMDEPSRMQQGRTAFFKVLGRIRQPATYNGCFITGSPRGANWIAKVFDQLENLPSEAWETGVETKSGYYIRAAKTKDNVANPESYYTSLVDAYGEQFALQELAGDIVAQEGRIYPNFYPSVHVIPHELAIKLYNTTRYRAGGADWGWTAPAANIYGGATGDYTHVIIGEFYARGRETQEQAREAYRYTQQPYMIKNYYCDPSDPGEIDHWRRGVRYGDSTLHVPALPADNDWFAGTRTVRAALDIRGVGKIDHPAKEDGNKLGCPRMLISERCEHLISEMQEYREEEKVEGKAVSENTTGEDHALDALRYYVMGIEAKWKGSPGRMYKGLS